MNDLIDRLEKAMAPDGELDAYLWLLTEPVAARRCFYNATPGLPKPFPDKLPLGLGRNAVIANAPHYMASIDAALALIPEGFHWELKRAPHRKGFFAETWAPTGKVVAGIGDAPNAGTALCIAALKARAALSSAESHS